MFPRTGVKGLAGMNAPSDSQSVPRSGEVDPGGPPDRPEPTAPGRVDIVLDAPRAWVRHLWWVALVCGSAAGVYVWLATPHVREIESIWHLAARLVMFVLICCGIAFLPTRSGRLWWLTYIPFVFFVAYIYPRIGYFYFVDTDTSEAGSFYTHQFLLSYPAMLLTAALAFRLGGGSPGRALKMAVNGGLILFSGLLDYMWWLVNPVDLPEHIDAPHITILTGGPISYHLTILFIAAHIPIIVAITLLPLDRWLGRLFGVTVPRG